MWATDAHGCIIAHIDFDTMAHLAYFPTPHGSGMNYAMAYEVVGYHGTNSELVSSIVTGNFKQSRNDDDWLGYGVYFFVDGISCPIGNAAEWARNQAYSRGGYRYDNYTVLEATARCNNMLDLRHQDHLAGFQKVRDRILQEHDKYFTRRRSTSHDDRIMWNAVADIMELDAIVHNLYIKRNLERRRKIRSNVPNTTVMCVKETDSIDVETIQVISTGVVKP